MASPKAAIFGLQGTTLLAEEKNFFHRVNPLGFILFARNCESPDQLKALISSLKSIQERDDVLILIDQEGGRVARLKPPYWRKAPAAKLFADYAQSTSVNEGELEVYANARLIAQELYQLGINVNCAPLADVPVPGSHNIIGDRAFGNEPQQVALLADAQARGLLDGGVLPVLKHIPGHGRARADSHEELPVVYESLDILEKTDFIPFKKLSHLPLGMTAHILYTAIDDKLPATLSPTVINLIRREIGFDGLLMSDDLSMKALGGSFEDRTIQSLNAGCDIVLHCNGKMEEMLPIANVLPALSSQALERFAQAWAMLHKPYEYDYISAEKRIAALEGEYGRKTA